MKKYNSKITLVKTSRGCWGLDTVKGCKYGSSKYENGCYGTCYACSVASRYGYNFSDSTLRRFDSKKHENEIISELKQIDSGFIRIGVMGDPSECWGHTIDICNKISKANKKIVIITKHWEIIPDYLITEIKRLNLIINTSISALDTDNEIDHRLNEFNRAKGFCKSFLRVVTCRFNINNIQGLICNGIQNKLLSNKNTIETILRVNKNNPLVLAGVIDVENRDFLSNKSIASVRDKNIFFGYCEDCKEQCGASL